MKGIETLQTIARSNMKSVLANQDCDAVRAYRDFFLAEAIATECIIGFLGAGRHAPLYAVRVPMCDALDMAILSMSSEGHPIFRLDLSSAERRILSNVASVLCYFGRDALNNIPSKSDGIRFETLYAQLRGSAVEHVGGNLDHAHGDDFRDKRSGNWIACKYAQGARFELYDDAQERFEKQFGMNPWPHA